MAEISDDDLGLLVWCALDYDRRLPAGRAPDSVWDALSDEWRGKINHWQRATVDPLGAEFRLADLPGRRPLLPRGHIGAHADRGVRPACLAEGFQCLARGHARHPGVLDDVLDPRQPRPGRKLGAENPGPQLVSDLLVGRDG